MQTDIIAESERRPLLADGVVGTEFHRHGVAARECFDALNLTKPELVLQVHRGYISAVVDLIESNTFGANHYQLGKHGMADRSDEINRIGVALARQAIAAADRTVLAGSFSGTPGCLAEAIRTVELGSGDSHDCITLFRAR